MGPIREDGKKLVKLDGCHPFVSILCVLEAYRDGRPLLRRNPSSPLPSLSWHFASRFRAFVRALHPGDFSGSHTASTIRLIG